MLSKLATLVGLDGVGGAALSIAEKVSGDKWTPDQKADFLLKYHAATKHLSVARRFIALSFMMGFAIFGLIWILSGISYTLYMWIMVSGTTLEQVTLSTQIHHIKAASLPELQTNIVLFLRDIFKEPMTWIVGFYFATSLVSQLKK